MNAIRKTAWTTVVPALLLSLLGVYFSANLLREHLGGTAAALIAPLCGGDDKNNSCDAVLQSRWAVFPPRPEEAQPADVEHAGLIPESQPADATESWRVPVATLGLVYFAAMAAWLVLIGRPSWDRRALHFVPLLIVLLGCGFSAWFIGLMTTQIGSLCKLCLVTHIINFVMLPFLLLAWPVRPAATESTDSGTAPAAERSHPSMRLVASMLLLAAAIYVAAVEYSKAADLHAKHVELTKAFEEVSGDANRFIYAFWQQEQVKIPVRDDDPILPAMPGTRMTLVLFSDLQCPHCLAFEKNLANEFLPLFQFHLRVVFKHFPLCSECNPEAEAKNANMHPMACQAAYLAEAVRMQAGSTGFWIAKKHLKLRKEPWSDAEVAVLAGAITTELAKSRLNVRIDAGRLLADFKGEAVRKRVAEDVELARSLGVRGTPTAYVNERLVSRYALNMKGFWQHMAETVISAYNQAQATATAPAKTD